MHISKSLRIFALAAFGAVIVLGVPPAAARNQALPHSRSATGATADATTWPQSPNWLRKLMAEARSHSTRAISPKITIGNFANCPPLPAGDDPTQSICVLIHITGGTLQIGATNQTINRNITISLADGVDSTGTTTLIPGVFKSPPMPVLGGIFENPLVDKIVQTDPNLQLSVKPIGVGMQADPTGNTIVILSQKIKALNPVFGSTCFVGSTQTPIVLDPTFDTTNPPPPNQPESGHLDSVSLVGNEIVAIGTVVDNAFAAPAAAGCGPADSLDRVVNAVGGLPSPAGTNNAVFQVTAELIQYSNI